MTKVEFEQFKNQTFETISGLQEKLAAQEQLIIEKNTIIERLDGDRKVKDTFLTEMKTQKLRRKN